MGTTVAMMTCPKCNGAGIVNVLWRGLPESAGDVTECPCCDGKGSITQAHARRLEAGRQLRRDRIARGLSLQQEARRLGIEPRELSDLEWGR